MHLNLVLSHFLSSSHLILPLQCWINFKGRWSQKSFTLALLMDSQQPCTARAVTCTVTQIYHGAGGKEKGAGGGVCLFIPLLGSLSGHLQRLLRWWGVVYLLLEEPVAMQSAQQCRESWKGGWLGQPGRRGWLIPEAHRPGASEEMISSLHPQITPCCPTRSCVLVFCGSHLRYFRQSQKTEKILFFYSKDNFFAVAYHQESRTGHKGNSSSKQRSPPGLYPIWFYSLTSKDQRGWCPK